MTKAKRKPARKPPARTTRRTPASRGSARNAELEAAIVAAPDDFAPRMVYGDWLQAQGDPRGEWAALMAGVEAAPDDTRLRSAAVAFLGEHRKDVLGEGAATMAGAYFGWRGGFIDELRLQPIGRIQSKHVVALLRHPTCRFVRHVAFGRLVGIEAILDELVALAPPLLEELVVIDDLGGGTTITADAVAELPALRRLSLSCATISEPMPALVELLIQDDLDQLAWLVTSRFPALEELVVIGRRSWSGERASSFRTFAEVVRDLPALRRLRVIGELNASALISALSAVPTRLELVDVSHCHVDAGALAQLRAWDRPPQVLALGTSPRTPANSIAIDNVGDAWITHRLRTEGRDAIRRIPGAGLVLYNLGTNQIIANERDRRAIPILDAAATLPNAAVGTYPLANAAIAHEKQMELDEAELRAREALLRAPREPNFHAILIDALRRTGRLDAALAALPAAYKAISKAPRRGHRGAIGACLLDCMFVLAQAGRHADLIALADKYERQVTADCQCVIAIAYLALGKLPSARAAMKQTREVEHPVVHHARAAIHAAAGQAQQARDELELARAKNYTELAWLERELGAATKLRARASGAPSTPNRSRARGSGSRKRSR